MTTLNFDHLLPPIGTVRAYVQQVLKEDIPKFDIGGFVVGDKPSVALLLGKSPGILSGTAFAKDIFDELGLETEWYVNEGGEITAENAAAKKPVAKVTGPAHRILLAERSALNLLARSSGIATEARRMNKIKSEMGWHGEIAGTRKTTPGFGLVEKYSLLVGGVSTHRLDLSSMVMLKDNHVWSVGNITEAVRKARIAAGFSTKIEVECRSLEEALEAAKAGAEIVMLDNYTAEEMEKDAAKIKVEFPHIIIEASGGITEETLRDYMSKSVDVISMGRLTQGYSTLDFSLKIQRSNE